MTARDGHPWPVIARRAGLLFGSLVLLAALLGGLAVLSALLGRLEGEFAGLATAFYFVVFVLLLLWPLSGVAYLVLYGRTASRRAGGKGHRAAPWTCGIVGGLAAAPLGVIPLLFLVGPFPGGGTLMLAACVGIVGGVGGWIGASFGRRVRDRAGMRLEQRTRREPDSPHLPRGK